MYTYDKRMYFPFFKDYRLEATACQGHKNSIARSQ